MRNAPGGTEKRSVRALLAILAMLVAGPTAAQETPRPSATPAEVVVTGRGEVRLPPDRGALELSVETRARTAAEAGAENARRQRAVLDTLRRLGLASDDISTVGYGISPDWRSESGDRPPRQVGYVARNGVRVELRDLDRLGSIIDAALAAGANGVGAVHFRSSREGEAQLAALDSAVTQARARAAVMARAAGGTLGALRQLSTERYEPPPGIRLQALQVMDLEQQGTPITPGQLSVVAVVVGRWEFVAGPR